MKPRLLQTSTALLATAGCALLTYAVVGSATAASAAALPSQNCQSGGPTAADAALAGQLSSQIHTDRLAGIDAGQVSCARTITQLVRNAGLDKRAAVLAVTTAAAESTLHDYTQADDEDSLGLFQQRSSQGWGTPAQTIDPTHSTNAFLSHLQSAYPNGAWESGDIGAICQRIQGSKFPDEYDKQLDAATLLVNNVWQSPLQATTSAGAVLDSSGTEHTSVTTSTGLVYTVAGSGNDWTLSSRNNLNGSTPTGSGGENYFPASNRYSLFSIGGGSLYQKNYSGGTWDSSWKNIGGTTVTGGVAAMVDKDNHQHLYVTTSNGTVYSVATNNGWHWSTIPGITAHGTPAIDYNPATGTYHLYVISNGTLYENTNTGTGWNTHWTKIGGTTLTGGLAAVIDKTGHQHIFAINGDHDLYSVVNNNGWNWTNHGGGHLTGTPKVLYNPTTDYYDIFIASNGTLVHKEYIHGAWQGSYHTIAGTNITD